MIDVTIGIIVFNRENTIKACIDSALNQTYKAKQILIVDDCSTDNTLKFIKDYKNKTIELIQNKENKGIPYSRNILIENSVGEIIVFFDSDDFSFPNRVKKQVDYLINSPNIFGKKLLCFTNRIISKNGIELHRVDGLSPDKYLNKTMSKKVAYFLLGIYTNNNLFGTTATCTLAAWKDWLIELGYFDTKFKRSEDTDLSINNSFMGGSFISVSETCVKQTITKKQYNILKTEFKYHKLLIAKWSHKLSFFQYQYSKLWLSFRFNFMSKYFISATFRLLFLFLVAPILTIKKIFFSYKNISINKTINS